MAEDRISYEMLQDMLRSERRSNKLTPVSTRFWKDVRGFLEEVMAAFREEQQKDPFSRRVMMVTDEVKHARQAVEAIWALRERKMALFALSQVRETTPKRPDGLTPDEERIYDFVLDALSRGRQAVLEGQPLPAPGTPAQEVALPPGPAAPASPAGPAGPASHTPPTPDEAPPATPGQAESETSAEPTVTIGPRSPPTVPADTPDVDMVMIRALSDIPAFVGPDMQTYLLKEGDVATVPKPIAGLLERRKKAAVIGA